MKHERSRNDFTGLRTGARSGVFLQCGICTFTSVKDLNVRHRNKRSPLLLLTQVCSAPLQFGFTVHKQLSHLQRGATCQKYTI